MNETTIEITNYCPHYCLPCPSRSTRSFEHAWFLPVQDIRNRVNAKNWDRIIISGGEPVSHPEFYKHLRKLRDSFIKATEPK